MRILIDIKKLKYVFLVFFFCLNTYALAEEPLKSSYFPLLLSLYKDISLPTPARSINTTLSLGVLNTQYNSLYGIGVSLTYQKALEDVYGIQLAPINIAHKSLSGAQIGFYNQIEETHNGIQIGLVNIADEFNGIQLGLFNHSKNGRGIQLGLINYDESEEGITLGPINIIKNGVFRMSSIYSLQNQLAVQSEFGGRFIYTMVRYKYDFYASIFKYYLGFGSQINMYKDKIHFYPQIFMTGFGIPLREYGLTTKFGFLLNEYFELVSGIDSTLDLNVSNSSGGFAHENKYKFDAFLGLQINFKKSPVNFLLN
jgi:hypothetical protein